MENAVKHSFYTIYFPQLFCIILLIIIASYGILIMEAGTGRMRVSWQTVWRMTQAGILTPTYIMRDGLMDM